MRLREDLRAVRSRDPAARSGLEIVLAYSGMHALWAHRASHALWNAGLRLPARLHAQLVRSLTGVEIHPAATIGRRVVIDHGMGIVIGATAIVGDDVLIYHGVTLGGRTLQQGKRHPTIGDRVIIGAGAKVIGPVTVGDDSRIGANAVVTRDAKPGSTLVGVPARELGSTPGVPVELDLGAGI